MNEALGCLKHAAGTPVSLPGAINQRVDAVTNRAMLQRWPASMNFNTDQTAKKPLFIGASARVIFAADIDVFDNLAVTFIAIVVETEATTAGVRFTITAILLNSSHTERLANRPNSVREIIEFVDECITHGSPTYRSRTEHHRHYQHEFCGDNKTRLIINKLTHGEHLI